jgi:hypothetical protein
MISIEQYNSLKEGSKVKFKSARPGWENYNGTLGTIIEKEYSTNFSTNLSKVKTILYEIRWKKEIPHLSTFACFWHEWIDEIINSDIKCRK